MTQRPRRHWHRSSTTPAHTPPPDSIRPGARDMLMSLVRLAAALL
jgi:hypothetical protein